MPARQAQSVSRLTGNRFSRVGQNRTMTLSSADFSLEAAPESSSDTGSSSAAGSARRSPVTIHLVGPGKVGRAFLAWLANTPYRLVGVTDSSATCHDRRGLSAGEICRFKAEGGRLGQRPDAETLPVNLAVDLVNADVVVDATPTTPGREEEAIQRGFGVLRRKGRLVLAAKDALCRAASEWLTGDQRQRVGCNAVLGGTGRALMRELDELRERCREVVLVPNASTTAILKEIEGGRTLEQGIRQAQRRGFLEADPTLDLDGSDAAVKLAIVASALWQEPVPLERVSRQDIRSLDPELTRALTSRGFTTRLVARAVQGSKLQVAYETLPVTSYLCTPTDRVVYSYMLEGGEARVHTGTGLGPVETARALLQDVQELAVCLGAA